MAQQLIPLITPDMFRNLPDQTTEILNRLITEVNSARLERMEITNTIIALQKQVKNLQPQPGPSGWTQVLQFELARMGAIPDHCLENTRLGFGIQQGHFNTARLDMESQIANGTLHYGTPPSDIAVPIYYDNERTEGHVAVWDHGIVYSDKVQYGSIDAVASGYKGWGELCDNVRVVSPAS